MITETEAINSGVLMDTVKVCKEIRKLANLDRIVFNESVHYSGINKHLFSYINYCGLDPKSYIKEYLSNLQPFMLERFPAKLEQSNKKLKKVLTPGFSCATIL